MEKNLRNNLSPVGDGLLLFFSNIAKPTNQETRGYIKFYCYFWLNPGLTWYLIYTTQMELYAQQSFRWKSCLNIISDL